MTTTSQSESNDYIRRRDYLLGVMRRQSMLWEKNVEDDSLTPNSSKRGRKVTKPNKFVEKEKSTKMYAPKRTGGYNWFDNNEN